MRYTFDSRVRYSEIDHRGTMTLTAMMNHLQDCSNFQSEALGLGFRTLKEEKRAWILSYWEVEIDRYPGMGESITTGTFASEFKGLFGKRNFFIQDETGEMVLRANSIWVFMNTENGRPVKPQEADIRPYGSEEPLAMEYQGRKIRLPETGKVLEPFQVRRHHIDTNNHVNNCQYIQMAAEFLPESMQVKRLRVDEGRTVVGLCDEAENVFAVIEVR